MVHLDNIWHDMPSLPAIIAHVGPHFLTNIYKLLIYPYSGNFLEGFEGSWHLENPYCTFSFNFSTTVITSFRDASVIAYTCALINPFNS